MDANCLAKLKGVADLLGAELVDEQLDEVLTIDIDESDAHGLNVDWHVVAHLLDGLDDLRLGRVRLDASLDSVHDSLAHCAREAVRLLDDVVVDLGSRSVLALWANVDHLANLLWVLFSRKRYFCCLINCVFKFEQLTL